MFEFIESVCSSLGMMNEAFKYRKWKKLWIYQFLFSIFSVNASDDCFSSGLSVGHCHRIATHARLLSMAAFFASISYSPSMAQYFFPMNDDMKSHNKYCYLAVSNFFRHWINSSFTFPLSVLIQFAYFFSLDVDSASLLLLYLLGRNRLKNERFEMSIRFGLFVNSFYLSLDATISFVRNPQWMQTIKSTTMIVHRRLSLSKMKIPPFTSVSIIISESSPIPFQQYVGDIKPTTTKK